LKVWLKIIATSVPAVCIALGFVAIFGFKSGSGWWFVLIGVILQALYLIGRFRR